MKVGGGSFQNLSKKEMRFRIFHKKGEVGKKGGGSITNLSKVLFLSVCGAVYVFSQFIPFLSVFFVSQEGLTLLESNQHMNDFCK